MTNIDEHIDGDDMEVDVVQLPRVGRKRGYRQPVATVGPVQAFIVWACIGGTCFWQNVFGHEDAEEVKDAINGDAVVIGVSFARWYFESIPVAVDRDCKSYQTMRAKSKKGSNNGHQLRGYLTWTLLHFFCLSGTDNQPSFPPTLHWLLSKQGFKKDARDDDVSFKTIFKNMETRYDVRLNTLCNYFVDINLALFFGDAEFPIMHTVPLFKKRRIFKRRLLENSPSNTQLWKWINAQTETVEGDGDASAPKASRWGGLSVDKVLKFLDATRLLRQLHEFKNARGKFRALEDALTDEPRTFEPRTEWNYESLRKARISIDGLWCLLFRQFWLTLPYEDIFLYVWIDSSPQFKGHELFSASFDLVVGSVDQFFMHRLYPQICISRGMYTRWGKVYAFLWQVFYVRVQVTRKYDSILLRSVGFVRISARRSGLSTPLTV